MDLKGTKTEKNLMEAFIGESKARNKYTFFASQARKDGYEYVAKIFDETANNEKEHAKIWFKLLEGGTIKNTLDNLKNASEGEHYEWTDMYAKFAHEAKEEGFDSISNLFQEIRKIEKRHEERYNKLLFLVENNEMFSKKEEVNWDCLNCGYILKSKKAPEKCPFCSHEKAYFESEE